MMSPDAISIPRIPKETARAASAIFGRGNFYIQVGEQLDSILEDVDCAPFLRKTGRSAFEYSTLPLITFFQFMERLTDNQAIDALRTRTDWKYALHLSLLSGILHETALCQFRQRVICDPASQSEFQKLVDRLVGLGPLPSPAFQKSSAEEVIDSVCTFNCLSTAQQTMQQTLEVLAARFPEWLRKIALPHWYGRYNPAVPLVDAARRIAQREFLMEEITSDIHHLLEKVGRSGLPEISQLAEVKALQQVWLPQAQRFGQAASDRQELLSHKLCEDCSYAGAGWRR
jgi:transposase